MRALSTVLIAIAIVALLLAVGFFARGPAGTDSGDLYLWIGGLFTAIAVVSGSLGVAAARHHGGRTPKV